MQLDEKSIIIQNWFQKADEALNDAQIAILNDSLSNAQNRIYYSIFYSVMALGYANGFITSKHSQLLGWFNKTFIKEAVLNKKLSNVYKTAYDNRMKNDYTFTYKPEKEDVIKAFNDADFFIGEIKLFLNI